MSYLLYGVKDIYVTHSVKQDVHGCLRLLFGVSYVALEARNEFLLGFNSRQDLLLDFGGWEEDFDTLEVFLTYLRHHCIIAIDYCIVLKGEVNIPGQVV